MPDLAAGAGINLAVDQSTGVLRISTDVVSGRLAFATYAELATETTQQPGTVAEIPTSDTGTHTDPVVGGTVNNSGVYSWSASPAGWERIADTDALSAQAAADAAEGYRDAALAAYAPVLSQVGKEAGAADTTYGTSTATASTASNGSGFAPNVMTSAPGLLKSVTLNVSASGTGNLEVVQLVGGVRTIIKTIAVTVAAGLQTLTGFSSYIVPAGCTIAYRRLTGGNLKITAGGGGSCVSYTDADAADGTVTIAPQTVGIALAFTLSQSTVTIEPRLASADEAELQFLTNGLDHTATQSATYGQTAADTSTAPDGNAYSAGVPVKKPSLLTGGSVRVAAAGPGRVEVYRPQAADGQFKLVYSQAVAVAAAGVNTLSLPKPYFKLMAGDEVAYRPENATAGARPRFQNTGGNAMLFAAATFTSVGVTGAGTRGSILLSFAYTVTELSGASLRQLLGTSNLAASVRTGFALERQRFSGTSTPANWVLGAGFTVNNGLTFTGTGSWTTFSYWNAYSCTHKRTLAQRFTVADAATVFCPIATQPQAGQTLHGSAVQVNGTTNKLGIYYWNGTSTGTLIKDVTIPALNTTHSYVVKLVKDDLTVTATLTDLTTQVSTSVSWSFGDAGASPPLFKGRPAVIGISGTFTAQWEDVYSNAPRFLRALIFGDSNSDGSVATTINPTWAQSLAAARVTATGVPDILLSNKQQDATSEAALRINSDLLPYRPEYVVIALGTNDTSQTTWRQKMALLINAAERVGAEPILVCLMPKQSATVLGAAMNSDIRSGYFGNYRYIDFAIPLSSGNDGETWNATYDNGGGVHFNAAGQAVMWAAVQQQAPYLLAA